MQDRRAQHYYDEADQLLPAEDRAALLPARLMTYTYQGILRKIRACQYQVLDKRVELGAFHRFRALTFYLPQFWWQQLRNRSGRV
jgi:phytoene synthase